MFLLLLPSNFRRYAGVFSVLPEYAAHFGGVDRADSFNTNAHKAMLTNFDCSLLFVKDRSALLDALSISPEYLRNRASESGHVIDYRDWQIPLGRRFRSLKLWFVMRLYGAEGIRAHLRSQIEQAQHVEALVRQDARFEIFVPREFGLVLAPMSVLTA